MEKQESPNNLKVLKAMYPLKEPARPTDIAILAGLNRLITGQVLKGLGKEGLVEKPWTAPQ